MRQKDKVEKLLEDYPDVFADIINVLIYDGKQVISPKQRIVPYMSRKEIY